MTVSRPNGDARLGDGMNILASIRARLFGLSILELHADVTLTPQARSEGAAVETGLKGSRRMTGPMRNRTTALPPRNGNGPIGSGLGDVHRALEAGAADLAEARKRMP
jgi:hypothetical protein